MSELRVLIADDELAARQKLRRLLDVYNDVEIIAEARDGGEAEELIQNIHPDIVFLDIDMPVKTGMEVIRDVRNTDYHLVFVTAHDHYAVDAFETHAVDYLLKPITAKRLERCLRKIQSADTRGIRDWAKFLDSIDTNPAPAQLAIRHGSATRIIEASHIAWLEAVQGYCLAHLNSNGAAVHQQSTLVTDTSLTQTHQMLPKQQFLRIHRATVVNTDHILGYWSEHRRMYLRLREFESTPFAVSRNRTSLVRQRWTVI